jgi:hypothetical protein
MSRREAFAFEAKAERRVGAIDTLLEVTLFAARCTFSPFM